MAYGDYSKRKVSGRPPHSGRGLGVRSKEIVKKVKNVSLKKPDPFHPTSAQKEYSPGTQRSTRKEVGRAKKSH